MVVTRRLFNSPCKDAQEDVSLHATLSLMEDRALGERALHAPERVLRAREQVIDAPRLLGAEVGAVGLQYVAAVETLGEFTPWLVERIGEAIALERRDVDLAHRMLAVRQTKFNRSRRLPLLPSVVAALGIASGGRLGYGPSGLGASKGAEPHIMRP